MRASFQGCHFSINYCLETCNGKVETEATFVFRFAQTFLTDASAANINFRGAFLERST